MWKYIGYGYLCLCIFGLIIHFSSISSSSNDCSNPQIKGNMTTYNGGDIYHIPGGQYYDVTDAEEMFCTAEDAEKAGYRPSER
ncbi:hypothetical protein P8864_10135 [Priestia flexa]|uniref:sunset domain-containing protein n=1 Tax=Priestia flexa TaxID=86664 RepID=UPI000C246B95|nr:hypothetical protein [Priestia flexa]MEC0666251.1 hypothetical protein [Priestia flexa]